VSYFQAGKICDYIKTKWGYDKLLAMMYDFANGQDTPAVIQKELGLKPEDFDKEFLASLEAQTKSQVEGFENWQKKMRQVAELTRARKFDEVIREAAAARDLYPDYVEGGNAYQFLADAYVEKGNKAAAIAELDRYAKMGGRNPATLKQLAALQTEAGNKKAAAAALERLNYIFPLDSDLHQKLGDLWLDQGNVAGAIREYQAVVAGKPLDPAASHFNLAKAYRMANRDGEAKDELLLALEAAPGYRPAQKLLLELSK
ncbi:MAG TPA: tetratricopeptide repeat protein, partial [Bryobacteraceae bacterium]|nr:tetratricopeptide repeat protein [Bryobacteraceae bacterium]